MKRGKLRLAFDRTIRAAEGLDTTGLDAALVEAGRRIADQVDRGFDLGGPDALKSVYLIPHLANLLRELGVTPAARSAVERAAKESEVETSGGVSRIAELQQRARRHRTAS